MRLDLDPPIEDRPDCTVGDVPPSLVSNLVPATEEASLGKKKGGLQPDEDVWKGRDTEEAPRQRKGSVSTSSSASSVGLEQRERPAAVLIAAFEERDDARIILTRRSSSLRRHPGEISLPGGSIEEDELPRDAALREASEEISLDTAKVEILGCLPSTSTYRGGSLIVPVVGVLPERPILVPNKAEVEEIFDVGLTELATLSDYHEELWSYGVGDEGHSVHFFEVGRYLIWGATARIIVELLSFLTSS
jgi:8-oxo-dGTP pyrophosphatase MutT (NUDIX family)